MHIFRITTKPDAKYVIFYKMSTAKDFFEEFTKFAPQHTSIVLPLTFGMIAFSIICVFGYHHNERKLKDKYHDHSPNKEPEKVARLTVMLLLSFFISVMISDVTYTIIDWSKNKKWYVWKYKWFPYMLS